MKKILFALVLLLAIFSTSAYADISSGATGTLTFDTVGAELHADDTTATADSAFIGKCSNGVSVGWNTSVGGYSLVTQHQSGSKAYGTSSVTTSIWAEDATPGTVLDGSLSTTGTDDFSAWSEL